MNFEEFKEMIRDSAPESFVRHRLTDESCDVFERTPSIAQQSYGEFRRAIADLLDINPRGVAVIGSAKYGWSMSPEKVGNPYIHGQSDIDIAIVSREMFESAWTQIRRAYFNGYDDLRKLHRNDVFARFLVIHRASLSDSTYLRELRKRLLSLNKIVNEALGIENKATYRVYYDWPDVEAYHIKGLYSLKEVI